MAVQLKGISVTLPSVGVSLTPTTQQLAWGGESLLQGVSIAETSAVTPPSTAPALQFNFATNSMYIPMLPL